MSYRLSLFNIFNKLYNLQAYTELTMENCPCLYASNYIQIIYIIHKHSKRNRNQFRIPDHIKNPNRRESYCELCPYIVGQ